jgi:hypothetical protein
MIKGALILAVGYGLGYAKALDDTDNIHILREDLEKVREDFKTFVEDLKDPKPKSEFDDEPAPEEPVTPTEGETL